VIALLGSVLGASLLGSLHCAAMCGGFVCAVSGQGRPLASQVAWHAGRGAAYVVLVVLAGTFGAGVDRTLAPLGLPHAAAVITGVLLVVSGVLALLQAGGQRGLPSADPTPFARLVGSGLRGVRDWPLVPRTLVMGALTGLLPCGWLWAFVATAAGTGRPIAGALVMTAFWLGTLPVLAALGFAAGRALAPLRARLPVVTAIAMIVVGLLTVGGRFRPHTGHAGHGGHGDHAGHTMTVAPTSASPAANGEAGKAHGHGGH